MKLQLTDHAVIEVFSIEQLRGEIEGWGTAAIVASSPAHGFAIVFERAEALRKGS